MESVILFPALLILDLIPKFLGFRGLTNWYQMKYSYYTDSLLPVYFVLSLVTWGLVFRCLLNFMLTI